MTWKSNLHAYKCFVDWFSASVYINITIRLIVVYLFTISVHPLFILVTFSFRSAIRIRKEKSWILSFVMSAKRFMLNRTVLFCHNTCAYQILVISKNKGIYSDYVKRIWTSNICSCYFLNWKKKYTNKKNIIQLLLR